MTQSLASLGISAESIRAYDQRIPRYTSYPTAPCWTTAVGPAEWADHLRQRSENDRDLSLYVHIPFCGKRCLFCGCNVIITTKEGVAGDYLNRLEREVQLVRELWRGAGKVIQLHLGGGTPNYLTSDEMSRLNAIVSGAFTFSESAERSIEVDPRVATPEEIRQLAQVSGFRRISFGVQDFHEETQHAIGREQTLECTFANVAAARDAGFKSVNIDLIYGLPRQTAESWSASLDRVRELRPDRIALYNFAFLPGKLPHQRVLDEHEMPGAPLKLEMFIEAHERLTAEGWSFIGMDHYALAGDSLTQAQQAGTLRRNFMGYTTLRGTNLLGFGTSAISDFEGAFVQNVKKLSQYNSMIAEGLLPVERGLIRSADDELRRFIIEELMCNGVLRYDGARGSEISELVQVETARLHPLVDDGLIQLDPDALRVTHKGRLFLRNIAVVFDAYLKSSSDALLFSRAV
ncbi:MAG: oxygen-independent coproporphyrinogen III oxidase [Candidatus Sumerlaeaceae bacterium]